jgi:ABC-type branched-subunit amino acid transport system substrate-binding protein
VAILLLVLALAASACRADEAAAPDDDAATDEPEEAQTTEPEGATGEETEPVAEEDGVLTDVGVTDEPCPDAVNPDNGCIYLGTISDLTVGPFAPLAVPITNSQAAFWQRVNSEGGIGGYDIDVVTYVRDAEYNPEIHNRMYQEIRGDVLALAQTLGSSQTLAIIEDMRADDVIGAPASWNSAWEFDDIIVESGANYCFEAMNGVDWAVGAREGIASVMAVYYPNDYGADAAAGVQAAADAHGLEFTGVETPPGQDNQGGAVEAILGAQPDLVFLTTGPAEMAAIVGGTAARGFTGMFVGSSPTWNPALLQTAAAPALEALYFQAGPWGPWDTDTPGHQAMRDTLQVEQINDGFTAGWVWSYPMRAAIEAAVAAGDLTRAGLRSAAASLESVDYEGMLPPEAGAYSGDPSEIAFRQSVISGVDTEATTGVSIVQDFFTGPTAEAYDFSAPCFDLG